MPGKPTQTRQSGLTPSEEVVEEQSQELERTAEASITTERKTLFRTPGWHRLRVNWRNEDVVILTQAQSAVQERMIHVFRDAYQTMYEIYAVVRTPVVDEHNSVVLDRDGFPTWKRSPAGNYEEDYTRLTESEKERFLFSITTRLFAWEQSAADIWGEAMFAKAQWEERFAIAFDAPMSGTEADRTAKGNMDAAEEKYFALFLSLYSRKADSLVRSMALLGQRLKDSLA